MLDGVKALDGWSVAGEWQLFFDQHKTLVLQNIVPLRCLHKKIKPRYRS